MKNFVSFIYLAVLLIGLSLLATLVPQARAEQTGLSPESGATSTIKTMYDNLVSLSYGTDTATPDLGTYLNRIKTASEWTPSATATASDIKTGKTFYGSSRTEETGTYPNPTNCLTEIYDDGHGSPVTETTNCSLTWGAPITSVTGDDNRVGRGPKDPRTGLVWSKNLINSGGTVEFADSGYSTWSWNATGANNIAVGNKTASQLCSERGNGWRLPTQKELSQAYIDGSWWNLFQSDNYYWSVTEFSVSDAWRTGLSIGTTHYLAKSTLYCVRCVRSE